MRVHVELQNEYIQFCMNVLSYECIYSNDKTVQQKYQIWEYQIKSVINVIHC